MRFTGTVSLALLSLVASRTFSHTSNPSRALGQNAGLGSKTTNKTLYWVKAAEFGSRCVARYEHKRTELLNSLLTLISQSFAYPSFKKFIFYHHFYCTQGSRRVMGPIPAVLGRLHTGQVASLSQGHLQRQTTIQATHFLLPIYGVLCGGLYSALISQTERP